MKQQILLALTLGAIGCSGGAVAEKLGLVESPTASPDGFSMVGSKTLTEEQISRLLYLQWPQSAEAIEDLLGYPNVRETNADYYVMPNGKSLTIFFSEGKAVQFAIGESR